MGLALHNVKCQQGVLQNGLIEEGNQQVTRRLYSQYCNESQHGICQ